MAFTALGQAQATAGKVNDAMATLEQGLAMRRRYPVGPWGRIHHLMVMSRVAVQAGEIPMAQELLSDLTARMSRFPDGMTAMRARQAAIQAALRERSPRARTRRSSPRASARSCCCSRAR